MQKDDLDEAKEAFTEAVTDLKEAKAELAPTSTDAYPPVSSPLGPP